MTLNSDFNNQIQEIIKNAIREDVGSGDHSSLACIPSTTTGKAKLLIKDTGILAGVHFAKAVFNFVDPDLKMETFINDGDTISYGDTAFTVSGSSLSILKAERLVLNTMQRMSAIATKTKTLVDLVAGTNTKILDTRKTTPNLRILEKWAVKIGGGHNHRFGLYDMIMLKDNHIDFCGGITKALQKTKTYLKVNNLDLKIIVEARDLKEIQEILEAGGVYRILIDNFSPEETLKAIELIAGRCLTESSGGIDQTNIRQYAKCGVDYISSGAITHSVHNLDLSLKAM